uniref:Uncharacterized protein n=1 Tax=Arundo donax TaxID=35708 RepID=A0A0A8ZMC1_ARUDO
MTLGPFRVDLDVQALQNH